MLFRSGRDDEDYGSGGARNDSDDAAYPQLAAGAQTLREHLIWQLSLTPLPERDRRVVTLLIDSLDDDGYLQQDLDELAALLPPELEIGIEELHVALRHLQNLEPVGVGARDPGECLRLQLEALPETTPYREQALVTVKDHLDAFAGRDYARLKRLLQLSTLELNQEIEKFLQDNPLQEFFDRSEEHTSELQSQR